MPPTSVHFNGSVNLPDTETVMREISARVPAGVRRMTDGETGERGYWIQFQMRMIAGMPEFEPVSSGQAYETDDPDAPVSSMLRLADGVSADAIRWPDLGYASAYIASFGVFEGLQGEGTIAADVRFQLQYPTPLASIASSIVPADLPAVVTSYEAALFADLDRALAAIPHDRCAVQWDVAVEFALLEGAYGPDAHLPLAQISPGLVRCLDRVPADVPCGMHLCYGDYGHEHFVQPTSLATQVEVVNAVAGEGSRSLDWASFTVPQATTDAGYFAPLGELRAGPDLELYLGIVPYHPDAQAEGTRAEQIRLVEQALGAGRAWGVSTECGLGRVPREEVGRLLDIHSELVAAG